MKLIPQLLKLTIIALRICISYSKDFKELKNVVKHLNKVHDYESVSIFISGDFWLDTDSLFPLLEEDELSSMKPTLVITTNFSSPIGIAQILNGSPLSLVMAETHTSYIMELATANLRGLRRNPIIFYVKHKPDDLLKNLESYCAWTVKTQFVNSLVMFSDSHQRFGCEYYPYTHAVNQTDWLPQKLLSNSNQEKALDFKGKIIKVPVSEDKPRVFTISYDRATKWMKLSGICWKVFKNYVLYSNGKVHPYPLYEPGESYRSIDEVLEMVENKTVICPPNCFADLNLQKFSTSHPIEIVDWCFMVPVVGKVPSYKYIFAPFQTDTYVILIFAMILTGGVFWILVGFKNFSLGLLNGLCGFIALGFCANLEGAHEMISRCFQFLIRVAGFIFTNYYNSLLASFLATTLFGQQIDTILELARTNLKIMLREEDYNDLKILDLPGNVKENLLVHSGNVVAEHRNHLNDSYGYIITSDRWQFHEAQQASMKVKALRFSKICYAQYLLAFPLWYDNMFTEPLNHFILRCLSSGLTSHWQDVSFRDFRKTGDINSTYIGSEAMPMDVQYFKYAWVCLVIGSVLSLAVFFFELFYLYV